MWHVVAKLQEIPATFTAATGWPYADECCLVTSIDFAKEWPLQFSRSADVQTGVSAVSVGGGWAQFVTDHELGDGAFLTFEVVDERTLVVGVHAVGALGNYDSPEQAQITEVDCWQLCREQWHPTGDSCEAPQSLRHVLTEVASDPRQIQFVKTLHKTHLKKNDGGRLVSCVPNSFRNVGTHFIMIGSSAEGGRALSFLWRSAPNLTSCGNSCGGSRMCRLCTGVRMERRRSMAEATLSTARCRRGA